MNTGIELIKKDIEYIKKSVDSIEIKLERNYATKEELDVVRVYLDNKIRPIERIIYSMVGLILVTVLGAILAIVIKK